MKFALLASGSRGNCCIIKHQDAQILIDCGTTRKYLHSCFAKLQYDYQQADALLVTHNHSDHISQIKLFQDHKKYGPEAIEEQEIQIVSPYEEFDVGSIHVQVLPMSHDVSCVGYVLHAGDEKLVYITDTGYIKAEVKPYIENADYYIFESNHDIELLMQTNRPVYVKQRIINDCGHLCNDESATILAQIIGDKTKEIVLAHISQEGNTRALALETLQACLQAHGIDSSRFKLHAAGQFEIYLGGKR